MIQLPPNDMSESTQRELLFQTCLVHNRNFKASSPTKKKKTDVNAHFRLRRKAQQPKALQWPFSANIVATKIEASSRYQIWYLPRPSHCRTSTNGEDQVGHIVRLPDFSVP